MLNLKIKKLKSKNNKSIKVLKNLEAIIYDADNYLTNQNLGMFLKRHGEGFVFQPMDKYVKIYEKVDIPDPEVENIIPRKRAVRKVLKNKTNKNKKN